jgi:hypothetical protein
LQTINVFELFEGIPIYAKIVIYSRRFCGKTITKHIVWQINIYDLVMKKKISADRKHSRNEGRGTEGMKRKVLQWS